MGKPKAPKPPDPAKLAEAQGQANQQTAITQSLLNMVNQQTPWGSLSYSQRGSVNGVPQFTATTNLSPRQQNMLDSQQNLVARQQDRTYNALREPYRTPSGSLQMPDRRFLPGMPGSQSVPGFDHLASILGIPGSINMSGLPGGGQLPNMANMSRGGVLPDLGSLPNAPEASDAVRQRTEDAMYQRAKAQLDPQFEERARRLENQLVNQGFARGSEGYNNAMQRYRQSENDAYQAALQDAIMAGGVEQSRLFDLEGQARDRAFGEQAGMFGMGEALRGREFGEQAAMFDMGEDQRTRAMNELLQQFEADAQRFGMSLADRQQGVNEILQQFGMGQQVFDQDMRRRQQMHGEQGDRFDQALQRRQQNINEGVLRRNQPLNELLAMMGMGTQIGMPQWAPSPQTGVGQTDVMGAHALNQQAQQNAFQAQSQQHQGMLGGLTNLAGTALGGWLMSDPETKENRESFKPEQALEGMRNIPVEQWNYKGDAQRRVGPMADDWANEFGGDGKTIDVVSAFGMSQAAIQALADKVDKLERQRG